VVRRWLTADADASAWPGAGHRAQRPGACEPPQQRSSGAAAGEGDGLPANVVALVPRTERGGDRA